MKRHGATIFDIEQAIIRLEKERTDLRTSVALRTHDLAYAQQRLLQAKRLLEEKRQRIRLRKETLAMLKSDQ